MGKKKPPPTDPQRFGDTSNVGSSSGWTDEKHMLYITFLEKSFVNQLYSSKGEMNSAEKFYGKVEVDGDGAESKLSEVGYIGSPSCAGGSHYYMDDDDASTNGQRQGRVTSYHPRQSNSRGSAAFHLGQHGYSFSWRESSDQNFLDGETQGSRGSSKNQHNQGRPT